MTHLGREEEIKNLIEFYLSDSNLKYDKSLREKIMKDPMGFVPLEFLAGLTKLSSLKPKPDEMAEAVRASEDLELDGAMKKIRRKYNKPLPDLAFLNQKRKIETMTKRKEDPTEFDDDSCDESDIGGLDRKTIDPMILDIKTEGDTTGITWSIILSAFKSANPDVEAVYCRFKEKKGNIAVLKYPDVETSFKPRFEVNGVPFDVEKTTGDNLIDFWKYNSEHFANSTKNNEKLSKKSKNTKKSSKKAECHIKLGDKEFSTILSIRIEAKKILSSSKDNQPLDPEDEKIILDILKYHSNYQSKISDLSYITTGVHPKYSDTKCFFIIKKDDTREDFSLAKCLNNIQL